VSRAGRSAERGSTIVEVMVAVCILIVAGLGFAGTSQYAATATGIGHRRTAATFLRAGLIDRLNVTPRSILRGIDAAHPSTWIVDACYDGSVQLIEPANTGYSTTFTCPTEAVYRSWIRVTGNGGPGQAWAVATNAWAVGLYVERIDPGCTAAHRDASVACVSSDLLLTD
jgi:Tfp pilus assembly protein PilV